MLKISTLHAFVLHLFVQLYHDLKGHEAFVTYVNTKDGVFEKEVRDQWLNWNPHRSNFKVDVNAKSACQQYQQQFWGMFDDPVHGRKTMDHYLSMLEKKKDGKLLRQFEGRDKTIKQLQSTNAETARAAVSPLVLAAMHLVFDLILTYRNYSFLVRHQLAAKKVTIENVLVFILCAVGADKEVP